MWLPSSGPPTSSYVCVQFVVCGPFVQLASPNKSFAEIPRFFVFCVFSAKNSEWTRMNKFAGFWMKSFHRVSRVVHYSRCDRHQSASYSSSSIRSFICVAHVASLMSWRFQFRERRKWEVQLSGQHFLNHQLKEQRNLLSSWTGSEKLS